MIIYRYLTREILLTMAAVSSILLLIIMSGRFVRYLAEAVSGKIAVDILLGIMLYRLPGFIELVLPLGFFIAILLAYGRLYMDSEMVVLSSCGMSQKQLLGITYISAIIVALLVGCMSLWISPLGALKTEKLLAEQRSRSEFTMLRGGYFQPINNGEQVIYIETLSSNREQLNRLFVAQMANPKTGSKASVAVAEHARQILNPIYGQRYLQLEDGFRYEGTPGMRDYSVTQFKKLFQHMPEPNLSAAYKRAIDARATLDLFADDSRESQAALQWRLSLPILVLVVTLMAVPLSRTSPRQGRYLKMLPAILFYMIYLGTLSGVRGSIESGAWPVMPGLWLVHGAFFGVAMLLFSGGNLWRALRQSMTRNAHA